MEEVRAASYEERSRARLSAEILQSNLQLENPSFIKSMVRSHVYSCFWLVSSCTLPMLKQHAWDGEKRRVAEYHG